MAENGPAGGCSGAEEELAGRKQKGRCTAAWEPLRTGRTAGLE
ncbi:hypothetical protein B2K_03580 [Paenibacillus mucilaginosus K02]|uniref:Uncharacterized protein n=1 Tax=Paenibacillus mucilaginosus K02 TaxID=997761 RepID=I0BBR9_9BACL|nr:hypothetical protein B2K_03580 [Paenibacillus mucilaginosus K02]